MANSSKTGGVQLLVTKLVLGTAGAVILSIDALQRAYLTDLNLLAMPRSHHVNEYKVPLRFSDGVHRRHAQSDIIMAHMRPVIVVVVMNLEMM